MDNILRITTQGWVREFKLCTGGWLRNSVKRQAGGLDCVRSKALLLAIPLLLFLDSVLVHVNFVYDFCRWVENISFETSLTDAIALFVDESYEVLPHLVSCGPVSLGHTQKKLFF